MHHIDEYVESYREVWMHADIWKVFSNRIEDIKKNIAQKKEFHWVSVGYERDITLENIGGEWTVSILTIGPEGPITPRSIQFVVGHEWDRLVACYTSIDEQIVNLTK